MSISITKEWKRDIFLNRKKIAISIIFLIVALSLIGLSGNYVDEVEAVSVPDLILSHIPSINLSFIFVYGLMLVVAVFIIYPLFYKPSKLHYVIGMVSLFLAVRSAFLVLTHLKIPAGAIHVSVPLFNALNYSNDLFFSGHAGFPFLGFLIFENKKVKYFMLAASVILAATVLLMHVHYSIDVVSAYFITYGVYKIGNKLFWDKKKN